MNITQIREIQGLTRRQMANKLGISENYLWMLESGKRRMSKSIQLQLKMIEQTFKKANGTYPNISTNPPTQHTSECHCEDESEKGCVLCGQCHNGVGAEDCIDIYQTKSIANTIVDNNHKLTEISAGIAAISNDIGAIAKLDTIIQHRVDNVMATRSRALIAVYNHHIIAQARVMVSSLETLIDLIKNGAITLDGAIIILEDLKRHLGDLRGYDPSDPLHNPVGDSSWEPTK